MTHHEHSQHININIHRNKNQETSFFPPITSLKTFLFPLLFCVSWDCIHSVSLPYSVIPLLHNECDNKKSITWCYNYYIWKRAQKERKEVSYLQAHAEVSSIIFYSHFIYIFVQCFCCFPYPFISYKIVRQNKKRGKNHRRKWRKFLLIKNGNQNKILFSNDDLFSKNLSCLPPEKWAFFREEKSICLIVPPFSRIIFFHFTPLSSVILLYYIEALVTLVIIAHNIKTKIFFFSSKYFLVLLLNCI